jgi:hypothetical protein
VRHPIGHLLFAARRAAATQQLHIHALSLYPVSDGPHFRRDGNA